MCKANKLGLSRRLVIVDENALVQNYIEGLPLTDICAKYNLSTPVMYDIIDKFKIARRHKAVTTDISDLAVDYQTLTMPELVNKYKASRPWIRKKARALGLVRPEKFLHKQETLTTTQKAQVLDLYLNQKKDMKSIANEFDMSEGGIRDFIYKSGNKQSRKEVIERRAATCIEKYGEVCPLVNEQIKEQIRSTNLKEYGTEHPMQSDKVKAKVVTTCLEKYGETSALASEEVKAKIKETNVNKYGVASPTQTKEVREKTKKTCLEKYGVENTFQHPEFKEKTQQTLMAKYGRPFPLQNIELLEKSKQTCLTRYGVDNTFKGAFFRTKIRETNISRYGSAFPNGCYGKTEGEIGAWLNTFGFNFDSNHSILEGKEIDLYSNDLKLGIEYCGLWWHNEKSPHPRLRNYHNDKRLKCEASGVRLITIFEDEWLNRQSQVKSFLKSILQKNTRKLYGRQCEVKSITKEVACEFIEQYHIQGKNYLCKHFSGLFYKDELVGVMTFGTHHRDTDKLVLDRLCFKEDVSVAGGSSRLFKHLLMTSQATSVISWSDNRWSQGNVYKSLGFTLDEELGPDYSYVDLKKCDKRISKQSQMKKNTGCPEDKTEHEFALEQGLARIYDCGKKRWLYTVVPV